MVIRWPCTGITVFKRKTDLACDLDKELLKENRGDDQKKSRTWRLVLHNTNKLKLLLPRAPWSFLAKLNVPFSILQIFDCP